MLIAHKWKPIEDLPAGVAPGAHFQGVVVAILETETRGMRTLASDEPFQTNYRESPDSAAARFAAWLDRSIAAGLNLWQRTLA